MRKYTVTPTNNPKDGFMACAPHVYKDNGNGYCARCRCFERRSWHSAAARQATIQAKFEKFHADNPDVYNSLEALASVWFLHGHTSCGIGMLWERLRWESGMMPLDRTSVYRLSNDYRSRYVRLLIERNPEWSGRFVTRELRVA